MKQEGTVDNLMGQILAFLSNFVFSEEVINLLPQIQIAVWGGMFLVFTLQRTSLLGLPGKNAFPWSRTLELRRG